MLPQMRPQGVEGRIFETIQPALESEGYELVRVKLVGGENQSILQIMLERLDGKRITLDECADMSYTISALLDVEDPIGGAYRLEVSSAGIDRPLTQEAQFEQYKGHEAKIELDMPSEEGRKRFRGVLKGLEGGKVAIEVDGVVYRLDVNRIRSARLVLTDALLKAQSPA